jgi:TolA-binding protein
VGFVPPAELLTHLRIARGLAEMRRQEHNVAVRTLASAAQVSPTRDLAAEAHYWGGIAVYWAGRDKDLLWRAWAELVRQYPESVWAARTTYLHGGGPGAEGRGPRR